METAQVQKKDLPREAGDKYDKIYKEGDLNEETAFLKAVQRYACYQLGKTPNSHKAHKPEVVQEDMIMIILHAIKTEAK